MTRGERLIREIKRMLSACISGDPQARLDDDKIRQLEAELERLEAKLEDYYDGLRDER